MDGPRLRPSGVCWATMWDLFHRKRKRSPSGSHQASPVCSATLGLQKSLSSGGLSGLDWKPARPVCTTGGSTSSCHRALCMLGTPRRTWRSSAPWSSLDMEADADGITVPPWTSSSLQYFARQVWRTIAQTYILPYCRSSPVRASISNLPWVWIGRLFQGCYYRPWGRSTHLQNLQIEGVSQPVVWSSSCGLLQMDQITWSRFFPGSWRAFCSSIEPRCCFSADPKFGCGWNGPRL